MIEAQQKKKDHNDGIVMLMEMTSHKKLALEFHDVSAPSGMLKYFLGNLNL